MYLFPRPRVSNETNPTLEINTIGKSSPRDIPLWCLAIESMFAFAASINERGEIAAAQIVLLFKTDISSSSRQRVAEEREIGEITRERS